MKELFIQLLNMSIVADWLILAVIVFRFAFRKAPKWIVGILWCLVGVRLMCPFSVKSALSFVPTAEMFAIEDEQVVVSTGIGNVDETLNAYLMQAYTEGEGGITEDTHLLSENVATVLLYVWVAGIAVILISGIVSYIRLKACVGDAVRREEGVYMTERLVTPFVFGVFKPTVYVPYRLSDEQLECVIMHERAHISRKDYIVKPIGYVLLAVYWFNPLVWVAYIMLSHDIELACDERVIRSLGFSKKKIYSQTLLELSALRNMGIACPVAFAEVGVRERIVNVMNLKKTKKGLMAGAIVVAIIVAVGFMSDPAKAENSKTQADSTSEAATSTGVSAVEKTEPTIEPVMESAVLKSENSKENGEVAKTSAAETSADPENSNTYGQGAGISLPKFIFPIDTADHRITSGFSESHQGVDIAAPKGTTLIASVSGKVTATGYDYKNGKFLVITHESGWSVYYNNCDSILVNVDDEVTVGESVAILGSTGASTGPHVHFAISDSEGNFAEPVFE